MFLIYVVGLENLSLQNLNRQEAWTGSDSIHQHDAPPALSCLCLDPTANFGPLISRCRLVTTYRSSMFKARDTRAKKVRLIIM